MRAACCVIAALVTGCGGDPPAPAPTDAQPPLDAVADAGGDAGPKTACGAGTPRLTLGTGRPFGPVPEAGYPIEAGRQGGYHIFVSLWVEGALDPDLLDAIELVLRDDEREIARFRQPSVYLLFEEPGPRCVYPNAVLVLMDRDGGLLQPEGFGPLLAQPLRLDVRVAARNATIRETYEITLSSSTPSE